MTPSCFINLLCCLMLLATSASATSQSKEDAVLEQVLKQMESVGKTFKNFRAHFTQKKYTAVLKEFDLPESGDFYYERAKDGSALLRQEVTKPALRVLTIKGGVAKIYQPALKQAQVVNLGKNKDKAEYLALGLGQSPAKLQKTFAMRVEGSETVHGTPCSILLLKPLNPAAAAYFSSITLWITNPGGIPIQQKLLEPNGDYLLVDFTEERINTNLAASIFDQKLPAGVEIQKIQ